MKIKDRVTLGALSGILAAIPGRLLSDLGYELGITDTRYNQLASRLFFSEDMADTPAAKGLGLLINNINVGATGVLLTYLLSATGKDHAKLKGAGLAAASWVMVEGLVGRRVLKIESKKPLSPLVGLGAHALYGAVCAELIIRLGDESLFPQKPGNPALEWPLLSSPQETAQR